MNQEEIRKELRSILDKERYRHSLSVERTAVALAKIYGVDRKKASLAALLHDCAKYMGGKQLLKEAKKRKLKLDPIFKKQPRLLHGIIGTYIAKERFHIKDKNILAAINHHTSGRPGMSKLEEVIYMADHIEPGRDYKNVKKIRKIAKKDLNKTIALVAEEMLKYLLEKGKVIYPLTLATRNHYLELAEGKRSE